MQREIAEAGGVAESSAPRLRTGEKDSGAGKFLAEALAELSDLDNDAGECDLPPPSPLARRMAESFLRAAFREVPLGYSVSPWENGGVVVGARGEAGHAVSVFFDASGEASCYVSHPESGDGGSERRYPVRAAENLPDDFVRNALLKIG